MSSTAGIGMAKNEEGLKLVLVNEGSCARKMVGIWLFGSTAWVFSMVLLGGVTRLTRSGLSMTDWKFTGSLPPLSEEEWLREFDKYKQSPKYKRFPQLVVLSGIALWSNKVAKAPKDKEHPYGHGKFETLGSLGISCMLLLTAGGIAWHALEILLGMRSSHPEIVDQSFSHEHVHHSGHHHGVEMDHPILALNMTIVSICVKEGLYWITKRAGERQGSGLMKANAWHHRADAVSSVVALIGVGKEHCLFYVLELVDAAIPGKHLESIKQTILQTEGVKGCHRMRGRRAGSYLYLDVHIEVDPLCSVSAGHYIGENVRHHIHKSHPEVAEVFIHRQTIQAGVSVIGARYSDALMLLQPLSELEALVQGVSKTHGYIVGRKSTSKRQLHLPLHQICYMKMTIVTGFQKMVVERVTHHLLQGKLLLQIEVSMPPEMSIRDAKEMAEEAENEILKAASNIIHVSIQLRLGHPIPQLNL
ncbi:metal tolerance protein 2-like [Quercus robur]|uniref:metal tolerance protein 2-like n=1 Tax=Quercus robur TaxID=38942 RepID=UPI00216195BC|nr:metal tolerance protein 2-like [Quercus robur]